MLYLPMDFGDLTIDGLIDTGTRLGTISRRFRNIEQIAPQKVLSQNSPPVFQNMVVNGHLETPIETTELPHEMVEIMFVRRFIVKASLGNLLFGLLFLQLNGTVFDKKQEILNFPSFSMQLKNGCIDLRTRNHMSWNLCLTHKKLFCSPVNKP